MYIVDWATTYSVGAVFPTIARFHFRKDIRSVLRVALSVLPSMLVSFGYSGATILLTELANVYSKLAFGSYYHGNHLKTV